MAYTLGFGKYKDRTLEWLFFNDPGYVWWMIDKGAEKNLKGAGRTRLMPYAFDQPDNAARLERLGVARVIGRKDYTARRAAAELDRLLKDARYAERAAMAARRIAQEEAVRAACDAVEECAGGRG
jgi:hypothetical protein